MRNKYLTFIFFSIGLLCVGLSVQQVQAQERKFKHPGLLHTQQDFDRIKQKLADGDPIVTAGWNALTSSWIANKAYGELWGVNETIKRGVSGDENYMNAYRNAAMAYQFALRWKISGNKDYAERAIRVLNAYPSVTTSLGGNSNVSLIPGFIGYQFANAAELMRDYDGWKRSDFESFKRWMVDIWFTWAQDFLKRHHGTCDSHYHSNWGAGNVLCCISVGILCDDISKYNYGMSYLKEGPGNESLNPSICGLGGGFIPWFHKDDRASQGYINQQQESGRDQPHCMAALNLTMMSCQTAWNQGDNVFSNIKSENGGGEQMLAGAAEYTALFNGYDANKTNELALLNAFPASAWTGCDSNFGGVSWSNRGSILPIWGLMVNHFCRRMGLSMPGIKRMKAIEGIESGGGSYGTNSGGFDNTGFGDLMFCDDSLGKHRTILYPRIVKDGTIRKYAEIKNVPPGTTLTLYADLGDETDTGNWTWEDGASGKSREVVADSSRIYRVNYTNKEGVVSTQAFFISVEGDAVHGLFTPYITYKEIATEDNEVVFVTANTGALVLGASFSNWGYTRSWKWKVNGTNISNATSTLTLSPAPSTDRVYTVICTDLAGAQDTANFTIKVLEATPYIQKDEETKVQTTAMSSYLGHDYTLSATPIGTVRSYSCLWDTGDTILSIKLKNLQDTCTHTLTFTNLKTGKQSVMTYTINVTNDVNVFLTNPTPECTGANTVADGWQIVNFTNGNSYSATSQHWSGDTSRWYFDSWNSTSGSMQYTIAQAITNLPNGTYSLTAAARTDGAGVYLCATAGQECLTSEVVNKGSIGGNIWTEAKNEYLARETDENESSTTTIEDPIAMMYKANSSTGYGWNWITVNNINVNDHTMTIAVSNVKSYTSGSKTWTGTWFSASDFSIKKISDEYKNGVGVEEILSDEIPLSAYMENGYIKVVGTSTYTVVTIDGKVIPSYARLSSGIYVVRTNTQAIKVLVP